MVTLLAAAGSFGCGRPDPDPESESVPEPSVVDELGVVEEYAFYLGSIAGGEAPPGEREPEAVPDTPYDPPPVRLLPPPVGWDVRIQGLLGQVHSGDAQLAAPTPCDPSAVRVAAKP